MVFNRKGQRPQCTTWPHQICAGCDHPIQRRERHIDLYGGHGPRGSDDCSFCGECWDLVQVASGPILQAVRGRGSSIDAKTLYGLIEGGFIGVLIQRPMTL